MSFPQDELNEPVDVPAFLRGATGNGPQPRERLGTETWRALGLPSVQPSGLTTLFGHFLGVAIGQAEDGDDAQVVVDQAMEYVSGMIEQRIVGAHGRRILSATLAMDLPLGRAVIQIPQMLRNRAAIELDDIWRPLELGIVRELAGRVAQLRARNAL